MAENELMFKAAFKYPFNRARRLWNILWFLLPIIGWFVLFGYAIDIVKYFLKGNFKELPKMEFGRDLKLGFFMFFKGLPFFLAYMAVTIAISFVPGIGILFNLFTGFFVVPMMTINFFKKQTVDSYFEFKKLKPVFTEIEDYVVMLLKSIGLSLVFLLMFLILVGIPAGVFTKYIFFADFYRRYIK